MDCSTGIFAQADIESDGESVPIELALGPADTLGDLEDVVERFIEAYCLSIGAEAFSLTDLRICLFDPKRFQVTAEDESEAEVAMSTRFAFGFVGQLGEKPSLLDPWLVVRPCTKPQVKTWYDLMLMTGAQAVQSYCLDPQLSGFFQVGD